MPAQLLNPGVPQAVADNSTWRCCLFYSCLRWLGSISEILRQCVIAVSGMKLPLTDAEVTILTPFGCGAPVTRAGWWCGVPSLHCDNHQKWASGPLLSFFPLLFFEHLLAWLFSGFVIFCFVFFPFSVALLICGECVFNVSKMLASV